MAHAVREEMMAFLRDHAMPDERYLFETELIVGEILSNSVKHAPGFVEITIDWRRMNPAIVVHDSGPGLAPVRARLPEDHYQEDGRGLFLIDTFSKEVAVRPLPGEGSEIRVVLPLERRTIRRSGDTVLPFRRRG